VPNTIRMDDHTPVRGLAEPREREDTIRAHVVPPGHPETDAPQPAAKRRGLTGAMFRSRDGDAPPPTWLILVATLLVGSGGTATAGQLLSPGVDAERVAAVEQSIAVNTATTAAKHAEHESAIAGNTAKIESIDERTRQSEQALWAEQIRTSRWMAEAIKDQSVAIAAIAEKLDVKVDLRIEPLGDGPR
jgi:hypothetical protein